jgi:hypothetical protein
LITEDKYIYFFETIVDTANLLIKALLLKKRNNDAKKVLGLLTMVALTNHFSHLIDFTKKIICFIILLIDF